MKQRLILSTIVLGLILSGCDPMKVDSPVERQGDLLPADFDYSAFIQLNDDMVVLQIAAIFGSKNRIWEDSLKKADTLNTTTVVNAMKKVEDSLFFLDTILVDTAKVLLVDSIYRLSYNKPKPASLLTAEINQVKRFNLYGRTGELDSIATYRETQIDTALLVQSYILYGIPEGRAYRPCTAQDAKTTAKSVNLEGVIVPLTGGRTKLDYSAYRFCSEPQENADPIFYVVPQE